MSNRCTGCLEQLWNMAGYDFCLTPRCPSAFMPSLVTANNLSSWAWMMEADHYKDVRHQYKPVSYHG